MPRSPKTARQASREKIGEGAVPAEELKADFPKIDLPIRPPYPPMEARSDDEIPSGPGWLYEPKWDGFRCLAFRSGDQVLLQSKAGQPLGRYFPEMVEALGKLPAKKFVLDGELVIIVGNKLSFDDLLLRIHPAESRIKKLAHEIPCTYLLFDMLVDERGKSMVELPLSDRRKKLEEFVLKHGSETGATPAAIRVSPVTRDRAQAQRWLSELAGQGFDGIVAKRMDAPYASGERTAMVKVKRMRTADCVVGGFRYASKGKWVGSLLLGLYNEQGLLDHVGFTSSFARDQREELTRTVEKLKGGEGFTGKAPGGPSRWSTERSAEWVPLKPKLVCEVQYDHFSGGRFRHGTKFLRWRPDKDPRQCTFEQVMPKTAKGLELLAG